MEHRDTAFHNVVRALGLRNIVLAPDFLVALIATCLLVCWGYYVPGVRTELLTIGPPVVGMAGGLLGIIVGAMAIVAALYDSALVERLRALGRWQVLLAIFWWDAAVAGIAAIAGMVLLLALADGVAATTRQVIAHAVFFLFSYLLMVTLSLVGTVFRCAVYEAACRDDGTNDHDPECAQTPNQHDTPADRDGADCDEPDMSRS